MSEFSEAQIREVIMRIADLSDAAALDFAEVLDECRNSKHVATKNECVKTMCEILYPERMGGIIVMESRTRETVHKL